VCCELHSTTHLSNGNSLFHRNPAAEVAFSDVLYSSGEFVRSIRNALTEDGIFVAQVGAESSLRDAANEFTVKKQEANFIRHLVDSGFVSVKDYSEAHTGLLGILRFLIAFASIHGRTRWYATEAEVHFAMRTRVKRTKTKGSSFATLTEQP
jgi:hypothetical protein